MLRRQHFAEPPPKMMDHHQNQTDEIIFLGVCERAVRVRDGNTNLYKVNLLGLKHVVLSQIFPLSFTGAWIGFAIRVSSSHRLRKYRRKYSLRLADKSMQVLSLFHIYAHSKSSNNDEAVSDLDDLKLSSPETGQLILTAPTQYGWTHVYTFLPVQPPSEPQLIIENPGVYYWQVVSDDGPRTFGQLEFVVADAPPLTPDRIAAIRSDPNASKAIKLELVCPSCISKCRTFAGLERFEVLEEEGWIWYQELPDKFTCKCGKTTTDLTIIRRNLHGLLGCPSHDEKNISPIALYEKNSLKTILSDFLHLVNSAKNEEQLQKFIEINPILLHQFPPQQLFFKPPILALYNADFGIVTSQRELILIELEKPSTRLLTKKGGVAAPLTRAFDQIRNWLSTVDEHRLAVLDSLKIAREHVSTVRGVVIAGRDTGYDPNALRTLKGSYVGRVTFLTYDDLGHALNSLIQKIDIL